MNKGFALLQMKLEGSVHVGWKNLIGSSLNKWNFVVVENNKVKTWLGGLILTPLSLLTTSVFNVHFLMLCIQKYG
jgi:hypothetical protein